MEAPLVTLTTDFGTADGYAAAMKGVLAARAPAARILDLSHDVPAHDVAAAAWLLLRAVPFFPPETIHLAVVDPGVGGRRRPLVLALGGQFCVGPDNGVFSLLPLRLAGPWRAVAIARARVAAAASSSAVFEGRDVFAPAAAALANALLERDSRGSRGRSLDLSRFGDPIPDWRRLPWSEPRREGADWVGEIVRVDRFGNAVTNLTAAHGPGPILAGGRRVERGRVYEDVPAGSPVALEGSSGFLEIALNRASASAALGLAVGDAVRLPAADPVTAGSPGAGA